MSPHRSSPSAAAGSRLALDRAPAPLAIAAAAPEAPPAPRGRLAGLDGVRGLAVLSVMLFHFLHEMEVTSPLEQVIRGATNLGAISVDLFFVLSGFLITGILLRARERPHYFRNFYMRRVLRIVPLYFGLLAVLFLLAPRLPLLRGTGLELLGRREAWAWLFAVNVQVGLAGTWSAGYLNHFWSLCVDEHFYLFWPLLVWWLGRLPPARQLRAFAGVLAAAVLARIAGHAAGLSVVTTFVLTPFRLDGLALGGLLAVLWTRPGGGAAIGRAVPRVAAAAGALLLATVAWTHLGGGGLAAVIGLKVLLLTALAAAVVMRAVTAPEGTLSARFFRSRAMAFLGKYSFGMYAFHYLLAHYFVLHRTERWFARWAGSHLLGVVAQTALGILVCVVLAVLSYELYERRFLALRRWFDDAPAPARPGLRAVP
jgi:peptidoglycan/LPS O-acetylase OafA/YrhL